MPNTESLDDGKYTTLSSISVVASRATVQATDIVARSTLSAAATTLSGAVTLNSTLSVGGAITASAAVTGNSTLSVGGAITASAGVTANSTASIGGAVTMQSTAQVRSAMTAIGWLYAGVFISSATTAQSGATSKISQQGQMYFSVLSLTSNGGEIGFRSGNTVYRFASTEVG